MLKTGLLTAGCFVCLLIAGCGEKSERGETIPVSGTVTWNDKPLTTGTITFTPDGGMQGRMAQGAIDSNGKYTLSTYKPGDGILPAKYKVSISAMSGEDQPEPKLGEETAEAEQPKRILPDKYYDMATSGLTAEIKEADSDRTIDFQLEGDRE